MKIKKEYIVLFIIIAALVLYIALRKESRMQYEIPVVEELARNEITGIVIQGNESETLLTKEKEQWLIGKDRYIADSYKIEKMINFLIKPVLVTVVSDSKDYMRYGLGNKNRIIVKALSGDKELRVVEIGYQADIRNHTFIKMENDHRVFHAKEDLRDIFSTDIDDIRDKTVLSFNIDKVDSIHFSGDGKELTFIKKEVISESEENKDTAYKWETEEGKIIDNAQVNSLLDDILKIKCAEYLYDTKKDNLENSVYTIRIRDENEHTLNVFPKEEDDDYLALSSDNPTPFSLYSWRIDNVIKKLDEMTGKVNEEENSF